MWPGDLVSPILMLFFIIVSGEHESLHLLGRKDPLQDLGPFEYISAE